MSILDRPISVQMTLREAFHLFTGIEAAIKFMEPACINPDNIIAVSNLGRIGNSIEKQSLMTLNEKELQEVTDELEKEL